MLPNTPTSRHRRPSLLVLGALAVGLGVLIAPTVAGAQGPTDVKAFMTLYGWADNSPPGAGIAHPCRHQTAGGVGTYANPITFATDVNELGWCQVIYVPYMKRYFVHEDECSQCDANWKSSHLYRFDMWAGGDANSLRSPKRKRSTPVRARGHVPTRSRTRTIRRSSSTHPPTCP